MATKIHPKPERAHPETSPAAAADVWPSMPAVGLPLLAGSQDLGPSGTATFPRAGLGDPRVPAATALKAFRTLAGLWGLGMHDQLTLLGLRETQKATYYRWLREIEAGAADLLLDRDPLDRIGHVLAIFEALGHLFQDPAQADTWVHRPNRHPLFQGRAPMVRLLGGGMADLIAVRAHLEAAREGLA
jgi:hypothetical protein